MRLKIKKLFAVLLLTFFVSPVFANAQTILSSTRTPSGTEIENPLTFTVEYDPATLAPACAFVDFIFLYFPPNSSDALRIVTPAVSTSTTVISDTVKIPIGSDVKTWAMLCYPSPAILIGEEGSPPAGGNQLQSFAIEGSLTGNPATRPTIFSMVSSGVAFLGFGSSENTVSGLGANVSDTTTSIFPVFLLSISVFLAFYIIQQLIFFFSGTQKLKNKKTKEKE